MTARAASLSATVGCAGRVVYDEVVTSLDTKRVAELLGVGRLLGQRLAVAAKRPKGKRNA